MIEDCKVINNLFEDGQHATENMTIVRMRPSDRRPGCSPTSGATDGIATDQGSRNDAQDAATGVGGHTFNSIVKLD